MVKRPCLTCGAPTDGARCNLPTCQPASREQPHHLRAKRAKRPYTHAERARRAQAVQAHRAEHGEWCPGWRTPPHPTHPSNPLTADHPLDVVLGGQETAQLGVLCRSCNSRKGADAQHAG